MILAEDYGVYSYDRPGWGANGEDPVGLAGNARHLAELIESFSQGPPVLVGYSYGAAVVLEYLRMSQLPGVSALLVAPAANAGAVGPLDRILEMEWLAGVLSLATSRGGHRLAKLPLNSGFRRVRSLLTESRGLAGELRNASGYQLKSASLGIVAGLADRVVPPSAVAALAADVDAAFVAWTPRAGHLIVWQEPKAIKAALDRLCAISG